MFECKQRPRIDNNGNMLQLWKIGESVIAADHVTLYFASDRTASLLNFFEIPIPEKLLETNADWGSHMI